jgi:hypothetical protein
VWAREWHGQQGRALLAFDCDRHRLDSRLRSAVGAHLPRWQATKRRGSVSALTKNVHRVVGTPPGDAGLAWMASLSSGRCPRDLFASLLPEHVRGHFRDRLGDWWHGGPPPDVLHEP